MVSRQRPANLGQKTVAADLYYNFFARGGVSYRLTARERKRIVLDHIYGVDLDAQAVEVTKLSLALKVLEGETAENIDNALKNHNERGLPDLGANITCGNSLIEPDFYSPRDPDEWARRNALSDEERARINDFDWRAQFPAVFKAGGFDVAIGNPPYGQLLMGEDDAYTGQKFKVFASTRDVYVAFIEQGQRCLRSGGKLSFIIPSAWLGGNNYKSLREFLLSKSLEQIILLPFDVFQDAYVDTLILSVRNERPSASHSVQTFVYPKKEKPTVIELEESQWDNVPLDLWRQSDDKKFVLSHGTLLLLEKIHKAFSTTFADFVLLKRGVLFDKSILSQTKQSSSYHPYFEGDVYRYVLNYEAPFFVPFGAKMKEYPKEFRWFEGSRLLLRRLVNRQQRLMATYTDETFITNKNLYSLVVRADKNLQEKFDKVVLGILNSKLISRLYIDQVSQASKDDFPQVTIRDVLALPMPKIIGPSHDQIVQLVETMLQLHADLTAATGARKSALEKRIATTDGQIDALVYQLYGLTAEEIALVEAT